MNTLEIREKKAELKRVRKVYLSKMDKLRNELKELTNPKPTPSPKVLSISTWELAPLPYRAFNSIHHLLNVKFGIRLSSQATLGDVIKLKLNDFANLPNCGKRSIDEIQSALGKFGLTLSK